MNEKRLPILNLNSLEILRRIAKCGSITLAAKENDVSQSALSRKLQEVEASLGFPVFERTTRRLNLTEPGRIFLEEVEAVPRIVAKALRRVDEECFGKQKTVRVGVSRSLSLAHLPGLFAGRGSCSAKIKLVHPTGKAVVGGVLSAKLDVGISVLGADFPNELNVMKKFEDEFVLISKDASPGNLRRKASLLAWSNKQRWLLPPEGSASRQVLESWLRGRGVEVGPEMELDSFDMMIQLVELGMGLAFVPRRALSAFRRSRKIVKLDIGEVPKREIGVFTRKLPEPSQIVEEFTKGILFS